MFQIPISLAMRYQAHFASKRIDANRLGEYKKWLQFFLDFCEKYQIIGDNAHRLRMFINKLKEKKQSEDQRRFAYHAISLYFDILKSDQVLSESPVSNTPPEASDSESPLQPAQEPYRFAESVKPQLNLSRKSHYSEAGYADTSDSPEWDEVLTKLAGEIKVRHYSRKTLKTYAIWLRKFQQFLKNKPPCDLSTEDVKAFLTYLAVKCKVAASTQNQAFNAILFLFRHALKKDFGKLHDVPRAKKSTYIPVVLSREEIDAIL